MSVQRQTLRLVGESPPEDFGERLERFMQGEWSWTAPARPARRG